MDYHIISKLRKVKEINPIVKALLNLPNRSNKKHADKRKKNMDKESRKLIHEYNHNKEW